MPVYFGLDLGRARYLGNRLYLKRRLHLGLAEPLRGRSAGRPALRRAAKALRLCKGFVERGRRGGLPEAPRRDALEAEAWPAAAEGRPGNSGV